MRTSCRTKWLAALLGACVVMSGCGKKDKSKKEPEPSGKTTEGPATGPEKPPDQPEKPPPPRAELPADSGEHTGKHIWSHSFGSLQRDEGKAIAIDSKGEVVVAGLFSGEVDFGGGTPIKAEEIDAVVARFGADGAHKWSMGIGGEGTDLAKAVAIDGGGNAVVAGWFSGSMKVGAMPLKSNGADDVFVVKIDPSGKVLWARKFGALNIDLGQGVAVLPDNSIVVTGEFRTTVDFGGGALKSAGDADIYLLKLGPDGSHIWSKSFGGAGQDYGRAVAVDSRGDILLAAEFTATVDFGGKKPLTHVGNRDVVLAKFDGDGKHIWSKGFGGSFNDLGLDLAVDPADNVIIVGSFEDSATVEGHELKAAGETDAYVAKFSADGKYLWSKTYGAESKDKASGVGTDKFGNVVLTGWFWHSVDFGGGALASPNRNMDAFLVKLGPDGKHLWSRNFGDKDHDKGFAVAVSADGKTALTGMYRFKLDLGGDAVLESKHKEGDKAPPADMFVAEFEP